MGGKRHSLCAVNKGETYRDAVRVLLPNTLGLSLALLKRMLVLELGAHLGDGKVLFLE